jgi:hypothetical protein
MLQKRYIARAIDLVSCIFWAFAYAARIHVGSRFPKIMNALQSLKTVRAIAEAAVRELPGNFTVAAVLPGEARGAYAEVLAAPAARRGAETDVDRHRSRFIRVGDPPGTCREVIELIGLDARAVARLHRDVDWLRGSRMSTEQRQQYVPSEADTGPGAIDPGESAFTSIAS